MPCTINVNSDQFIESEAEESSRSISDKRKVPLSIKGKRSESLRQNMAYRHKRINDLIVSNESALLMRNVTPLMYTISLSKPLLDFNSVLSSSNVQLTVQNCSYSPGQTLLIRGKLIWLVSHQ